MKKRKGLLCLVGLHKYKEVSDKSYFPYYKCNKCGKKVDALLGKKTSLKDVLSYGVLVLFFAFIIGSIIFLKATEEVVVDDVSVEFLEIEETNNEIYAVYVSHEEKAFFNLKISSYEKKYDVDSFESITTIEALPEGMGYKYSVLINGGVRTLNKHK